MFKHRHRLCQGFSVLLMIGILTLTGGITFGAEDLDEAFLNSAKQCQIDELQHLLRQGASVNAKDFRGWTALMWVAGEGKIDTVKMLIARGADVNAKSVDNITPLMRAARWGHSEVVKVLLEKGADPKVRGQDGWTASEAAGRFGHTAIKQIIEQAAK